MYKNYFDELKVRLFESCDWCNKQANDGDRNRNHVNYGSASAIARIMTDFGHNVHIPVWDDNGFLRIPKIVIDGEVFIDFEKSEIIRVYQNISEIKRTHTSPVNRFYCLRGYFFAKNHLGRNPGKSGSLAAILRPIIQVDFQKNFVPPLNPLPSAPLYHIFSKL